MSTYIGYAERDVANEINWATIGKNFTDMLKKEAEDREKRKADIDAATTKTLQTMADVPVAEHMGLAQRVLDFSTQGTNQLQMLDRLLKSGQLRPDQFIKQRETLLSGTKEGFDMVKEMDELFKMKMARRDKGQSSIVEQEIMALAEGFGDFSNMKFSINSADGTVMLAMGKKDPATGQVVIDESPDKLVPIATLRKRLRQDVDKVDINKEAEKLANVLGEEIRVLKKGGVLTRSDIMQRTPVYEKVETDYVKGVLSDPLKVASILTDVVKVDKNGTPYSVTFDASIAASDPSKILLTADPSSPSSGRFIASIDPNSEAYKQAFEAVRDRVRVMIDKKEEPTPIFAPQPPRQKTEGDKDREERIKRQADMVKMIGKIYYGDQGEMTSGLNYFKSLLMAQNPDIISVKKRGGSLDVIYKDNSYDPIQMSGTQMNDFIRATGAKLGLPDMEEAMRQANLDPNLNYNPIEGESTIQNRPSASVYNMWGNFLGNVPTQ